MKPSSSLKKKIFYIIGKKPNFQGEFLSQNWFQENLFPLGCNFSIPASSDPENNYLDFLTPWYYYYHVVFNLPQARQRN
jgi:hypothetical protein